MRETAKAKRAFVDYFNMGPGRSLQKLRQTYGDPAAENPPTKHLRTLENWSSAHNWQKRINEREAEIAQAQLEHYKETALDTGYAVHQKRVGDLNALGELLYEELLTDDKRWLPDVKQIGGGEFAERVDIVRFNSSLLDQFRGTLDDIAKETGGRQRRLDLTSGGEPLPEVLAKALEKVYGIEDDSDSDD